MVFVAGLGQAVVENGDWENEFVSNVMEVAERVKDQILNIDYQLRIFLFCPSDVRIPRPSRIYACISS